MKWSPRELMKKCFIMIFIISLSIILLKSNTYSCTIFTASDNNRTLAGNIVNWSTKDVFDEDAKVWFLPAEKSQFGRVFFGWADAIPQCGMNDHGLVFDAVAYLPRKFAPTNPQKMNYEGSILGKILAECSTLNQALLFFHKYNMRFLGYVRIMIVDEVGDSAIITWDWDKNEVKIIKKKDFYQVVGAEEQLIQSMFRENNKKISIKRFRDMLAASQLGPLTTYSNIYNLTQREIYVYYLHNFDKTVTFNLAKELKKGKHVYDLASLFSDNKITSFNSIFEKTYSTLVLIGLVLLIIILFSPFIIWPFQFIKEVKLQKLSISGQPNLTRTHSYLARLLAIINNSLCLVLIYYVIKYSLFIAQYGLEICGKTINFIPYLIFIFLIPELILGISLWQKRYWTKLNCIHYFLLILTTSLMVLLIVNLNYFTVWIVENIQYAKSL